MGVIPEFEWVFCCSTTLGGVAPGVRDSRFNGGPVRYAPSPELGSGARWCSPSWLALERGTRGFLARTQSGLSRFAMSVSGQVDRGTVVVVPDDQVETAAALAARLLAPDADEPGLREWSMAVVREPGRTRLAVRLGGGAGTDVVGAFVDDLDVEWLIEFEPGYSSSEGCSVPDHCTIRSPDGSIVGLLGGTVYLEDEPVSARLVEIAARFGNGLAQLGRPTGAINIPTGSHRPLEPDEWDVDRDHRWLLS